MLPSASASRMAVIVLTFKGIAVFVPIGKRRSPAPSGSAMDSFDDFFYTADPCGATDTTAFDPPLTSSGSAAFGHEVRILVVRHHHRYPSFGSRRR